MPRLRRLAIFRRLFRRLADRAAEGDIFVAPGELDEAAAAEAIAVAARRVAVAVDIGVDEIREPSRIGAIGLGRRGLENSAGQTWHARPGE